MRRPNRHASHVLVTMSIAASLVLASPATARPNAASPSHLAPVMGTDTGSILFQRDGLDRTEIALVRRDGTGEVALVPSLPGSDQTNPDWSPDGSRITFAMRQGDTEDLWVAGADGRRARKLVDCVSPCLYLDDPAWSPDGRRIVVSRTSDHEGVGVSTLETVDVRTGRSTVVLGPFDRHFTAGARWSPDGSRVVFEDVAKFTTAVDSDISGVTLSIVDMARREHRVRGLTRPELFAATADWSSTGTTIVYSALADPEAPAPDLFTISPAGGRPSQVTHVADAGGYANEPTFSRDGRALVFSGRTGSYEAPLLLEVGVRGGRVTSATGGVMTHGRHPRIRPTPQHG